MVVKREQEAGAGKQQEESWWYAQSTVFGSEFQHVSEPLAQASAEEKGELDLFETRNSG